MSRHPAPSSKPWLEPRGFFVLRTPLLPFDELVAWSEGLAAAGAGPHERSAALARDRQRLRVWLRAVIARPEVREALFVASPSLEAQLAHWLANADSERGRKVERALVRYVQRMAARATPFGLFGGCTVGEVGARTALALAPRAAYRRHTRLDMDHVLALTGALAADPELRGALTYRPNSSLYRAAGLLRYMEARATDAGRSYALVAVEPTDYLDAVLAHGRAGAPPDALAAALASGDPDVDVADARAFVELLIERQILVPELEPAVTGPEPVQALIAALDAVPGQATGARVARVLTGVHAALADIDAGGPGAEPARYRALADALAELPAPPALPRLFQVDMVKPAAAVTLGAEVTAEIVRGVEILRRLASPPDAELARFRERFEERYEQREVPLVEALDEESGIGFGTGPAEASPLLLGLDVGDEAAAGPASTSTWDARHASLQRKLLEAVRTGAIEIALDGGDLEALAVAAPPPWPPGLAAVAVLAAASADAVDRGAFRVYLYGARGPSGADLLARFCHADERMDAAVRALVAAEEAEEPGVIHAEIVHLPEGRAGNLLLRPVLRGYEIPYLGRAGAPRARQIQVEDLVLSLDRGRLRLRARRLAQEIRPYSTTAISTSEGPGVVRFLAALARQGTASTLRWSWGPLARSPHLPRVSVGRLVLDLARWRLGASELARLGEPPGEPLFSAAQALRAQRGLPRRVALVEDDNLLPVDLDNALSVESFAQLVKGRAEAELVEMFPGPDELCVRGPEGAFVHELVVPLGRVSGAAQVSGSGVRERPQVAQVGPRRFPPGSEWLYVKLYGGPATADRVLRVVIAPLVAEARAAGAVDGWFFVRYADPELHLRVRMHGPPARLWGEVLPRLHQATSAWLGDQRLWRLELGTYEREVERYGGDEGIALAEQIFMADSDAALSLVARLAGDAGLDVRWRAALCGIDRLLRDLGMDLAARQQAVEAARAVLGRRLGVDASLQRALGARYRQERLALEDLVAPALPEEHPLAGLDEVFGQRSARVAPLAAALRAADAGGRLTAPVTSLAGDLVHMHANRMLRGLALRQELVIYDLLARLYQARRARGRLD
ncbi:MAG TPA: lantibiotic dehydratase [Haliangium sp.]|nr:lantibiotic dehydratase [Haliangium sp.]